MLDPKFVRDHPEAVRELLHRRRGDVDLDRLLDLDSERRASLSERESLQHERKVASQEIGRAMKAGEDVDARRAEVKRIGERIKELEQRERDIDEQWSALLLEIPNRLHDSVVDGAGEDDNPEVRTWGTPAERGFEPKAHWDLGPALGIIDFERAAHISASRFTVLRGAGARLERALINFMLDRHTGEHGYTEIWPPSLVNAQSLVGTTQLPKFRDDLFKVEGHDLYLIPTAEVPVTNLHGGEILEGHWLPRHYVAYTPCFRSEAGSYGKDVRGMFRQHEFDKVELVKLTTPETSYEELEKLTANAEAILQALELPYRVVSLCAGDIGFGSALTYDLEVWLPSQGRYREISSCSNYEDFQARRANIRYRPEHGARPRFVHTLNGSGLAVGRTLIALLENGQREDGSVVLPEVLAPYMGGVTELRP